MCFDELIYINHFWQIDLPKQKPCCIVWNRQQVASVSMSMQTKQSTCVSIFKKETYSHKNGCSLKLVDRFNYLGSSVSSTENDKTNRLAKAWIAIDWLSIIWKSNRSGKNKTQFFPSNGHVHTTTYECTTWTLTKPREKKSDGNCTRMLWVIFVTICPTRPVPTISTSYISSWPPDRPAVPPISSRRHFTCFTNIQQI